jgi:cytochrome c-type biogenesis protein CcmE
VTALVQSADRYDGEVVRVVGLVAAYRERFSRSGEPYTAFDLRDGKASVAVFAWPHQGLRNGLRVRVTGTFFRLKTYGFIKAQRAVVVR